MEVNEKRGQIIPFLQNGAYFYKKGIEAYQNRKIDHAIQYIERAIRMEPDEPVFKCQLAIIRAEQGLYEEANVILEELILNKDDDTLSESHFFYANNLAHLGQLKSANQHLHKYLELDPDGEFSEDAYSLLDMIDSELLLNEDEVEQVQSGPEDMIIDYLNKGNNEWAEKEARGHLTKHPKEWDVYAYLAESLMNQGQEDEAESILKDLLLKNEPNFLAQCLMAQLLKKNNEEQAGIWVDNLIDLRPMNDWHQYYLAKTLFFLAEYDQSYRWYQKLSRKSSFHKFPAFYHQMAVIAWMNKDKKAAEKLWEKTKKLDPERSDIIDEYLTSLHLQNVDQLPNVKWFFYSM
ncbi:tetratricopeptide repeat protein [Evansella halocellulosilytica]|uniref:tetratricopeptide repeat protein n=1 Tax=Evansella halocellulosilytica TaxID=2011013 RepID=UPI00211BCBBB|nr:tetratricopeptide repeat protein [Evansella halocellulosilytica]